MNFRIIFCVALLAAGVLPAVTPTPYADEREETIYNVVLPFDLANDKSEIVQTAHVVHPHKWSSLDVDDDDPDGKLENLQPEIGDDLEVWPDESYGRVGRDESLQSIGKRRFGGFSGGFGGRPGFGFGFRAPIAKTSGKLGGNFGKINGGWSGFVGAKVSGQVGGLKGSVSGGVGASLTGNRDGSISQSGSGKVGAQGSKGGLKGSVKASTNGKFKQGFKTKVKVKVSIKLWGKQSQENSISTTEESIEEELQLASVSPTVQLLSQKVVKAQKYEVPVLTFDEWFARQHYGVVVTLADGRRFLIIRGHEFFRDQSTAILEADVMSDVWKLVQTKEPIQSATVDDYIRVSETSIGSRQAAERMMAELS